MNDQGAIEAKIMGALASEQDAISLSNQLFGPDGLFGQLAESEDERRRIVQTPLFKEAQRRVSALRREEAREFARSVEQFEAGRGGRRSPCRLERV
jgi:hypothetical protein